MKVPSWQPTIQSPQTINRHENSRWKDNYLPSTWCQSIVPNEQIIYSKLTSNFPHPPHWVGYRTSDTRIIARYKRNTKLWLVSSEFISKRCSVPWSKQVIWAKKFLRTSKSRMKSARNRKESSKTRQTSHTPNIKVKPSHTVYLLFIPPLQRKLLANIHIIKRNR